MIRATKIPQQPTNLLGQILADADLDYLGRTDFQEIASLLYKELSHQNNLLLEAEWDQIQIKFLRNCQANRNLQYAFQRTKYVLCG